MKKEENFFSHFTSNYFFFSLGDLEAGEMKYLKKQNAKSQSKKSEVRILTYQWGLLDDLGPVVLFSSSLFPEIHLGSKWR